MSSILTINDATTLSVGTEPQRFDSDFRFGTRKNITVEVVKLDSVNVSGIGNCADTADALRKTKNWDALKINGIDFGRAKLTDFNLEEGNWVQYTKATLTLQVYEEGDLENMEGDYYKGLTKLKDQGEFLDDFSEDFSFERSPDSTSYTYSLTLKFSSAAQISTSDSCIDGEVTLAYDCAREIINGESAARPQFALIDSEVKALYSDYAKGKKRLLRESVDLLNKTCTFTEEFKAYNIDSSYSSIIRQSLNLGEDGIVTVKENGKLLGLSTKTGDEIARVLPSVDSEIEEAIALPSGRLKEVFDAYTANWKCKEVPDLVANDSNTKLIVIKKGRVFDEFRGEASYDITCTNNQKYKEDVIHEYTVVTEKVQGRKADATTEKYRAKESGTITGKTVGEVDKDSDLDGDISWKKVKEYWESILGADGFVEPDGGGTPRIKDILTTPSPRLVSNSTVKSPWKVQIGYNQMVSEAPQFAENGGFAKSITLKEGKTVSVQKHKVGDVINAKRQILQKREAFSRDALTANIEMVGKRHATLGNLLTLAKTKLNDATYWPTEAKPQDSYTYINNCTYSFSDDNDIKLNLNIGWE